VAGEPGRELHSVSISPDGTKVAFRTDSAAVDNGYDLWLVPALDTSAPAQLSPTRPPGAATPAQLDVDPDVEWSPDSRYLAFTGDLTENGYPEAFVVDTEAASPTAVALVTRAEITATAGARGAAGMLAFDAAGRVYFRARLTDDPRYALFRATPAGVRTALPLPPRADASAPDASTFAVSPDGATLVFQADSPTAGTYNLFARAVDGATALPLTSLQAPGLVPHSYPPRFSPDGAQVAVLASYPDPFPDGVVQSRRTPTLVAVDGSGVRRLAAVPGSCVSCDYEELRWTIDGARLYGRADVLTDNEQEAFALAPGSTDQVPTLAADAPAGGDLDRLYVVVGAP
jgi:hypothetical protein